MSGPVQDGKPTEVPGAWLVQRAAVSHTVPEAHLPPAAVVAAATGDTVHQNPSNESLTDQGVLPEPGEKVRYKQSELMRLTAHRLASAAAAIQQPQPSHCLTAMATTELKRGSDPAVVQLSSLFLSSPTSVQPQLTSRPVWEDSSEAMHQAVLNSSAPATAEVDGMAACSGGDVPSQAVEQQGADELNSCAGDVCLNPEDERVPARAFSAPPESHTEGESMVHEQVAQSSADVFKLDVMDQGKQGQLVYNEDDTAFSRSSVDAGLTEFSSTGNNGGWKIPDGTVLHKRRSSRTVPGLLQTIAEAEQEEGV